MPNAEEIKFLAMPIVPGKNREKRCLSALRFVPPEDRAQILAERMALYSTHERDSSSTAISDCPVRNPLGPGSFERIMQNSIRRRQRVREINHEKWTKDVLNKDERNSQRADSIS